jgi:PIN domain nuclease of toxin-antitoxin system
MVLDASALLAYLHAEPGADMVAEALGADAVMSAVNWAEVVAKLHQGGLASHAWRSVLDDLRDIAVVPFTQPDAEAAAVLSLETGRLGLSLGDRACLVLADMRQDTALTADRAWSELLPRYRVRLIR